MSSPTWGNNFAVPLQADVAWLTDGAYVWAANCRPSGSIEQETCWARTTAGATFRDYGTAGASWTGAGESHFGVCLDSVSAASAIDWTVNPGCPVSDAPGWHAVPTAPVVLAQTPGAGLTFSTARLRFGARTLMGHVPGRYAAPILFEVVAT